MILLKYDGWEVRKSSTYPMVRHYCIDNGWYFYYNYEKLYRQTNCGYCAKSIPDAVVFVLEMIK